MMEWLEIMLRIRMAAIARVTSRYLYTVVQLLVSSMVIGGMVAVPGIAQGLVASYPFDGNANDATGNGHNGKVFGAKLTADRYGVPNRAYSFSGAGDYIEIPHDAALNFDGVDFSISAWIKFRGEQAGNLTGIICKGPSAGSPGWQFCILGKRFLGEELALSGGTADSMNSSVDVSATACTGWRHIVLVVRVSTGEIRLYVDGSLASSKIVGIIKTGFGNTAPCVIGAESNKTNFFLGAIDDVEIFNHALTQTDVLSLYSDGGQWSPSRSDMRISITPQIDFGAVVGCTSSTDKRSRRLGIGNDGPDSVTIVSASFRGPGLSIIQPLPITVAPNSGDYLYVQWIAQKVGPLVDTLQLQLSPCDTTILIPLSGNKQGSLVVYDDLFDFGQHLSCDSPVTAMLPITFFGETGENGMITDIVDSPPFVTALSDVPIASGATLNLPVTFAPTTDGAFVGTIRFTVQPCGSQCEIRLHGARATPDLVPPPPLMLGKVPFRDSITRTADFVNDGDASIAVDSLTGGAQGFEVEGTIPVLPARLDSGDTLHVLIEYHPVLGSSRARFHVVSSDLCGADVFVDVDGSGDTSGLRTSIMVPQLTARVGEHFVLPLESLSDVDLDTLGLYDFTAELAFDKTVMLPVDPTGLADSGRLSTLMINGRRPFGSTTLAEIPCVAALGDSDGTPIRVVGFTWRDADALPVKTHDGSLTIEGICRQGGVRLFNGSVRTAIKSIAPNPAGDHLKVEFDVGETGPVHLGLSDRLGSEARVLVEGDLASGTYEAECDLTGLATGIYWCVLRTPGTHAQASVTIKR